MVSLQLRGARLKQQAREVHEQMKAPTLGNDKIRIDLHRHFVEFFGRACMISFNIITSAPKLRHKKKQSYGTF